ncbi:MAG: DegQ family serine endoprotease [Desulfomonile tiedjei]|nr:DegQ family serine endoprotease [Desulfomonile tiedjei]
MTRNRSVGSLIAIALLVVTLIVAGAAAPASADPLTTIKELDQAYVQIAQKVAPTVVRVSSTKAAPVSGAEGLEPFLKQFPFSPFGEQGPQQPPQQRRGVEVMMGSGFIVSPDGLIMTNNHVVKDMKDIKVTLPGKREYKAKLVGTDPESDIALIKIDAKDLPPVQWGDSSKLHVGEIVVAIGNPFGLSGSVTSGIISATGRTNVGITGYEDFIQTDAPINPGNSGGPLVNIKGEVIGINTAIASRSGGYMGIGFAIPSNSAKLVMDQLVKSGKVERGLIGVNVQDLTESLAQSFGMKDTNGALVSQVVQGGPAEKAGVKPGDVIVDVNGQPVDGAQVLKNLIGQTKPGAALKLKIFRDKKTLDVNVVAAERTAQAVATGGQAGEASTELGIKVEKVPSEVASKLHLKGDQGLIVKEMKPDGQGAAMGLRTGDIILQVDGKTISDVATFNKEVAQAKKNGLIRFMIQRGTSTIFLAESFK